MKNYLAQQINIGGQSITGPLSGIATVGDLINKLIELVIPAAGIILLLVLIMGGYDFLISRGQPEKIKSAQAKITTGIIGFILLIASYIIVRLITKIFGYGEGVL